MSTVERNLDAWNEALNSGDFERWTEHLDRIEVSDHFGFLAENEAILVHDAPTSLHDWINHLGALTQTELFNILNDSATSVHEKLAAATFARWEDRMHELLLHHDNLPNEGVIQYFSDGLKLCIIVGYRRLGSTVVLEELLAVPEPEALFDPVQALSWARSDQELDLLRRALSSRHKVVIQRNVLTHIDREFESKVFGPSIDTLIINEWLFEHRYIPQRSLGNIRYFEEIMPSDLASETLTNGTRFLEIGSGNGLLTATFARNEAKIARICALDVLMPAVFATHRNSWNQRHLPRGGAIGDRARYITAQYSKDAVPLNNDLVVCNPPYIPFPPQSSGEKNLHPLRWATMGTELLESVLADVETLLAEKGQLVIVASDLAAFELANAVPKGFSAKRVKSVNVPFNVGPARREAGLLDWLSETRGLVKENNGYRHNVTVSIIERNS
jgi:methylase of polypeptide subunit release factors